MTQASRMEVEGTIARLLSEELKMPVDAFTGETNLRDLGLESIRVLRVISRLERNFAVELEDEVVFKVKTPRELADTILRLQGAGQAE